MEQVQTPTPYAPRFPFMDLDEWKAKALKNEAPTEVELRKGIVIPEIRKVKGETGTLRIIVSTPDVDRSKDTIDQSGWDLGSYAMNPVVLFGHDYWSPPIAKAPRTFVEEGRLVSMPEFCPPDLYPFGNMIGRMLGGGFLNAASPGFRPKEWAINEERGGVDFKVQELLEWSVVPVPDNPRAVQEAKAAWFDALDRAKTVGIDVRPVIDLVVNTGSWIRKSGLLDAGEIEESLRVLDRARVSVEMKGGSAFAGAVVKVDNDGAETVLPMEAVTKAIGVALREQAATAEKDGITGDLAAEILGVKVLVEKAGRVLSRANEGALRAAADSIATAAGRLSEVLEKVAQAPEAEDPPAEDPPADPPAEPEKAADPDPATVKIVVRDEAPAPAAEEPRFATSPETLKVLFREAAAVVLEDARRRAAGALPD